ncbi:SlyX family protein [Marinospirillum sp. MEB164]|uniref:Protein SlyX homolog n=1 Tax=Marinospirillum alkalitolerans TaxID=3123374 RepID=A0ABW8PTW5_9GAMM
MNQYEDRLITLESQLAFQDDLLEQLNQQVTHQSLELLQLQEQLRVLHARLENLSSRQNVDGTASQQQGGSLLQSLMDEKPPHY